MDDLLRRRIDIVNRLQGAGADVEPAALTSLAISALEQEERFGRWAASSVVLLGLGGTLIGLSVAVLNSQPLLTTAVQQSQATDAVIGMFSGLASAFSTTLMGIAWAVGLGLQLGALRKSQNEYLRELEELSFVYIYPHFRASPTEALVRASHSLNALQEKLTASVESMTTELRTRGLAMLKTIEDSFRGLVERTEATGIELRKATTGSLQDVVREMRERGVGLTSTVDRSFQLLTEELREGTGTLAKQLATTHQAVVQMLGDPGADATTLAQNLKTLQQGVGAMASAAEQMRQITPSIEEAIARQVDRQTRDVHESMHSYTKGLNASNEAQRQAIDDGRKAVENGIARLGVVLLESLAQHDTELLKAVAGSTDNLTMALNQQVEQLKPLLGGTEALKSAVEGFDSRIEKDADTSKAIKNAVDHLTTAVEDLRRLLKAADQAPAATIPATPPTQTTVLLPAPVTATSTPSEVTVRSGHTPFGAGVGSDFPPRNPEPQIERMPFLPLPPETGVRAMLRKLFNR